MVNFLYIRSRIKAVAIAVLSLLMTPQAANAQAPQWVSNLSNHQSLSGLNQTKRNDVTCVALAIYFEARGESQKGQRAVGNVVMNRVADRRYPNTPCGVLFQPRQFSFITRGRPSIPATRSPSWHQSVELARSIVTSQAHDASGGAKNFRHRRLRTAGLIIGNHVFF